MEQKAKPPARPALPAKPPAPPAVKKPAEDMDVQSAAPLPRAVPTLLLHDDEEEPYWRRYFGGED